MDLLALSPLVWAWIMAVALCAGFVKGAVGFAMPMILVSGLGSLLPADLTLAALILPTFATNAIQALRDGGEKAWATVLRFRRFIAIVLVMMLFSAQLVAYLPRNAVFVLLGLPVTLFAAAQLAGWVLHVRPQARARAEAAIALIAGFFGGVSGIWGPPTVTYLLAIGTEKDVQMRAQGVVYGAGSVMLVAAHLKSGVLNTATAPLSALLVIPALIGMTLGYRYQDRLDQRKFRRLTQVVLVIAGLNLLRRGLMG